MPTFLKRKSRSREMFYIGRSGREDAALHDPILNEGDDAQARAVTIARMQKRGWSDETIAKLLAHKKRPRHG